MSFAQERERRPNAGNRMRALLDQEIDMEVLFDYNENEVDEEFSDNDQEEEKDVLDSDFDLDSSEGEQEEIDEGKRIDKQLEKEERQTRKALPFKPPPSAAITKAAATQPTEQKTHNTTVRKRRSRIQHTDSSEILRHSSRRSTVLNRVLVEEQRKENELRRAAQPKRKRTEQTKLTQEELLAEAAITEEKNKTSLLEWQEKEAIRKENARKKDKKGIQGPFVRYHSFADGDPKKRPKVRQLFIIQQSQEEEEEDSGKNIVSEVKDKDILEWHKQKDYDDCELMGRTLISFINNDQPPDPSTTSTVGLSEKELEQMDLIEQFKPWLKRTPKPNSPVICPITGQVAKYRDPRTNIPFFNKEAYAIIRSCLDNEQGWSSSMGLFVGNVQSAKGVPKGWDNNV